MYRQELETVGTLSANLSDLKTPVVQRLEDGTLYGLEGAHVAAGCYEGSCTPVWKCQQTVPFFFPRLERSMYTADYQCNLRSDGGMPFRLQLPLGFSPVGGQPAAILRRPGSSAAS